MWSKKPALLLLMITVLGMLLGFQFYKNEEIRVLFRSMLFAITVPPSDGISNLKLMSSAQKNDTHTTNNTYRTTNQYTKTLQGSPAMAWLPNETQGVILTAMFTYAQDPQRSEAVVPDMEYIHNFYVSVKFYNLRAIIFHDGAFPDEFVAQYERQPNIHFQKVESPPFSNISMVSPNDFRFQVFYNYTTGQYATSKAEHERELPEWYLIADLRDVFFNSNPFSAMSAIRNRDNSTLFASNDHGTWWKNGFSKRSFRQCYRKPVPTPWRNHKFLNCGLWGGTAATTTCILKCMTDQFHSHVYKNFCDMVVYNYCVHFGECFGDANSTAEHANLGEHRLFNPYFGRSCDGPFTAVHNKCGPTYCLREENETLRTERQENRSTCIIVHV